MKGKRKDLIQRVRRKGGGKAGTATAATAETQSTQRKPSSHREQRGGAARRALDRPLVVFEIFTDSSSSSGGRNAKGCVCTGSSCPVKGAYGICHTLQSYIPRTNQLLHAAS